MIMKINKTLKQIQEFVCEKEKLANWHQSELVSIYNDKLQEYQTEE